MAILDLLPCNKQQRWRRLSDSLAVPEQIDENVPKQNITEKSCLLSHTDVSLTCSHSSASSSSSTIQIEEENGDYILDSENVHEKFPSSFELPLSEYYRPSQQQFLLAHSRSLNASKICNSGNVLSSSGIALPSTLKGSSSSAARWNGFKRLVRLPFKETQAPNVDSSACKHKIIESSKILETRTNVLDSKKMSITGGNGRNKQTSVDVHKKSSASKENFVSHNKYMNNPQSTNKKEVNTKSAVPVKDRCILTKMKRKTKGGQPLLQEHSTAW